MAISLKHANLTGAAANPSVLVDGPKWDSEHTLTAALSKILGTTALSPTVAELTASGVLDLIGSTQGQVLYRGPSGWTVLAPGTSGFVLTTGGGAADPSWAVGGVVGAQYLVGAADATLTAERVVTDTATVAWDLTVSAQAKANVPDDAVTDAKLANMGDSTIKGRASGAGAGDPTNLTASQVNEILKPFFSRSVSLSSTPTTLTAADSGKHVINFNANRTINLPALAANLVFALYTLDGGSGGDLTVVTNGGSLIFSDTILTSVTMPGASPGSRMIVACDGNNWVVYASDFRSDIATSRLVNDAVTNAKLANMGQNCIKGRRSGGTGDPEDLDESQVISIITSSLADALTVSGNRWAVITFVDAGGVMEIGRYIDFHNSDTDTSDNAVRLDTGGGTTDLFINNSNVIYRAGGTDIPTDDIADNAVTYAKIQNVSATARFLGRITAGAGDTEELTGTQATTLLDAFTSALKGLAPASGGGTANFLRADGTWTTPGGTNPWTLVKKSADETLATSTTLQNDDHLLFAVSANTKYAFRLALFINTPAAADYKYTFTGPASPTLIQFGHNDIAGDSTSDVEVSAAGFGTSINVSAASTVHIAEIHGVLQNGANAGTVTLQWAQLASSGTTTVYAGSYLEWMQI